MSNTYKHQHKFNYKCYDWMKWRYSQEPREAMERQFDHYSHANWKSSYKWARQKLRRSFRRKIKIKLAKGEYDTLPKAPTNIWWYLW